LKALMYETNRKEKIHLKIKEAQEDGRGKRRK
jgi:hypothetical protein